MDADRADPCRELDAAAGEAGPDGGLGRRLLLESAVLAALADQPAHGYDMRRTVAALSGGFLRVDPGHLYRLLRRLEHGGLVASAWVERSSGPQRREYRLTREGCAHLLSMRPQLEARERAFRAVIEAVDRAAAKAPRESGEGG